MAYVYIAVFSVPSKLTRRAKSSEKKEKKYFDQCSLSHGLGRDGCNSHHGHTAIYIFFFFNLAEKSGGSQVSQRSSSPRSRTARASFLVLALVAVALATNRAPSAKIVINVPANIVKNGSKVFFNKDYHGRLLLSEGLKGRFHEFQQFGK